MVLILNRRNVDLDNTIYPSAVQTKDGSVSPSPDHYQYQSATTADENEIDINGNYFIILMFSLIKSSR